MRTKKQMMRGEFPGEDIPQRWKKCLKCGYAQCYSPLVCPNCSGENLEDIK